MIDDIVEEFKSNWQYRKITRSLIIEIESFIKSRIKNDYKLEIKDNSIIISFAGKSLILG